MSHGPESASRPGAPSAHPSPAAGGEVSLSPFEGWHCRHLYYRFCRSTLKALRPEDLENGAEEIQQILDPSGQHAPTRIQVASTSGQRADFGVMALDADPLKLDSVHHRLMASALGSALVPAYSFVSLTEVSEYVPTVEQYGQRLVVEGEDPNGPGYRAKLKAYESREEMMRKQRLHPEFPAWPIQCFYPMNKKRKVGENWFALPFDERNKMMAEHGRSGMKFGGKVTQLITASIGFDDWEWGVTLWARNPQFIKDIVYVMRFDEASARYAEFGPFFIGYVCSAGDMLRQCRVIG